MIPQISKSVNGVKRDLSWAYFHLDIEVLACKKYLFLYTSSVCIMEVGNYKIKVATFSLWVVLKMNVQKNRSNTNGLTIWITAQNLIDCISNLFPLPTWRYSAMYKILSWLYYLKMENVN
jgi:hypothetical protein